MKNSWDRKGVKIFKDNQITQHSRLKNEPLPRKPKRTHPLLSQTNANFFRPFRSYKFLVRYLRLLHYFFNNVKFTKHNLSSSLSPFLPFSQIFFDLIKLASPNFFSLSFFDTQVILASIFVFKYGCVSNDSRMAQSYREEALRTAFSRSKFPDRLISRSSLIRAGLSYSKDEKGEST